VLVYAERISFYIANGKVWKTNQKVGMSQKEIIDSQDAGLRTHIF
jgi:hypothetical protein